MVSTANPVEIGVVHSCVFTAGTSPRDQKPLEELGDFPLQRPGSKLSSGDVIIPSKKNPQGAVQDLWGLGLPRWTYLMVEYSQHFSSVTVFKKSAANLQTGFFSNMEFKKNTWQVNQAHCWCENSRNIFVHQQTNFPNLQQFAATF